MYTEADVMKAFKKISVIILLLIPLSGFSQKWKLSRSEYIYGIGISNYFGDIGGSESADASRFLDLDFGASRPVLTGGYRYKLYELVSVKGGLSYANIHGTDVKSSNEGRNYAFTTNMLELQGQIEFHILKEQQMVSYKIMSMRGKLQKFNAGINLYVFGGIGGAFFMTKAKDNFVDSDRFESKNLTLAFPLGFGLKYPLSSTTYIGLEMGARYTTSDFIDGFHPDMSEFNDVYYFTVINVSTKIKRTKKTREYRF